MRILISTDVVGGVWSYTEELTAALASRGHEIALVAFGGGPSDAQRAWLTSHPQLESVVVSCPLEWMPEPEPGLSASVGVLRDAVASFAADVVHLNQFYYGAFELGAPALVVAHSDVVSWWRVVKRAEPPDDPWFRRYRGWVKAGLAGVKLRVAPSAWFARQLGGVYDAAAVRVVHNGRSAVSLGMDQAAGATRPRARRVVAAGRLWDEAKGVQDLIPAAAHLRAGIDVVVAGEVRHPAGGRNFPVDAPGIRWAGNLASAELRVLLRHTRVYAATSRYEPFGLAPLEAALAGCALVASDIPTFRELWDGCALFYPPGDGEALARAVSVLLADEERRLRLAHAARARALSHYSPERMARRYEALYRELLGQPGAVRASGVGGADSAAPQAGSGSALPPAGSGPVWPPAGSEPPSPPAGVGSAVPRAGSESTAAAGMLPDAGSALPESISRP